MKESLEQIEKVEMGRSVTYLVIGGDLKQMYDPYRVTFSFIPVEGEENEKCIAEWKAEFETLATQRLHLWQLSAKLLAQLYQFYFIIYCDQLSTCVKLTVINDV